MAKPARDIVTSKPQTYTGAAAPSAHDALKPVQPASSSGKRGPNQSGFGAAAGVLTSPRAKSHGIETSPYAGMASGRAKLGGSGRAKGIETS
jgi:hypothetical protein